MKVLESVRKIYGTAVMEVDQHGYPADPGYGMDHRTGNAAGNDITRGMRLMRHTSGEEIWVGNGLQPDMTYVRQGSIFWAFESRIDFTEHGFVFG